MQSEPVPVDSLTLLPYLQVLTYPKVSLRSAKARIRQLHALGVSEIVFQGHARVGRLGILGLGTVGIVVRARVGGEVFALKIRRTDSNRPDMSAEVKLTRFVNRLGIGPQVAADSNDFILMKLLEYEEFDSWLRGLKGPGRRMAAKEMVHGLLNQCRKLDIMGVDHGQLSNLRKHAVVAEGRPWIIDFESASTGRKPKNVTAAAQYLLIGGRISPLLRRVLGVLSTTKVLERLSAYKKDMTDYSYSKLLEELKLDKP